MAEEDIVGIIQVQLNAFTYQPKKGREEDPAIVKHLSDIFEREGCRPNLWGHHVKGEIDAATYSKLLTACGLSEDELRSTVKTGKHPRVRLRKRIVCLDGRQRIAAARAKFGKKFWWPVKLYRDPRVSRFSHQTKYPDGEICWHLFRLALGKADLGGDWRSELTQSKKKILNLLLRRENGIFKHRGIVAALCAVLEFPGTRREFKLGSMHKYTPLQCPKELGRYLHRMSRIYWRIIGHKASLMPYMDSKTFGCLEGRNPSNGVDGNYIRYMMDKGKIFRGLKSAPDRREIKRNLLSLNVVFPTLKTFHQNMMYFSVGVKILRDHITDDPEESQDGDQIDGEADFFQSLRMCWTQPNRPLIEISEAVVQPLASMDAELASMLLFLDGQRDCLHLSNEPFLILQDKRGEPTPAATVDPWYVFRLQARARQYGFDTKKIRHGLAVKPPPPRPVHWNLDDGGRAKQWRGGKPTIRNFLNLRRNAFLPTLDEADGREEVTAAFVQKDFLEAFFGPWSYMTDGSAMPGHLPSLPGKRRMQIDEEDGSPPSGDAMQVDEDVSRPQAHGESSRQTPYRYGLESHQTQEPQYAMPSADQINLPPDSAPQVDGDLVRAEAFKNTVEREDGSRKDRYQPPRRRDSKPRSRSPSSRSPTSKIRRERRNLGRSRSPIRPLSRTPPIPSPPIAEQLVEASLRRSPILPPNSTHALQVSVPDPNPAAHERLMPQEPVQQTTENLPRDEEMNRNIQSSSEVGPLKTPDRVTPGQPRRSPIRPPRSDIRPTLLGTAPAGLLQLGDPAQAERAKALQVQSADTSWPALPESPQAEPEPPNEPAEIATAVTHAESTLPATSPENEQPPVRHQNANAQEVLDQTADRQRTTENQAHADRPPRSPIARRLPTRASGPLGIDAPREPSRRPRIVSKAAPRRSERIRLPSQKPQTPRRSERIHLQRTSVIATPRKMQIQTHRQRLRAKPPQHNTTAVERSARYKHRSVLDTAPRAESSVHRNEAVQNALSQPEERRNLRGKQENVSRSRQRSRYRSRSPPSGERRRRSADRPSRSPIPPPGLTTRARDSPRDAHRSRSWSPSLQRRDLRNHQEESRAGQPRSIIPLPGPSTPIPSPPGAPINTEALSSSPTNSAYTPPPTEMWDPVQTNTKLSKQGESSRNGKASGQRDSDHRRISRRRSRRGSSPSRSPISRKRRRGSPPLQGLLTLSKDQTPPTSEALFKPIQSSICPPQGQAQESPEDPFQADSNHHTILQQVRESSVPSTAPDILDHHKSQFTVLEQFTSPGAKSLLQKLKARENRRSAVRDLGDAADRFILSPKRGTPNLQSLGPRSRPPVCPPEASRKRILNISVPNENTKEGRSRLSSVCTPGTYTVPISSSDEESSHQGQPTPPLSRTSIPRKRRRSPIRPPGPYPESSSCERSTTGRGQSHIRYLHPSGSEQESGPAQLPKTNRALVLTGQRGHDHFSQTRGEYPSDRSATDESEEL